MSNSASIAAAKKRRGVTSAPPQTRHTYNARESQFIPTKPLSQSELLLTHDKKLFMLENLLSTLNLGTHEKHLQKDLEENKLLNQLTSVTREVEDLRKRVEMLETNVSSSNQTAVLLKASMQSLSNELKERIDNIADLNNNVHSIEVGDTNNESSEVEVSSLIEPEEVLQEISDKKKEIQGGRKKRGKEVSLNIKESM